MKTQLLYTTKILTYMTLGILLMSCSGKVVPFTTSTVVPGAEGKVKVKKDDNQNYLINLEIDNLARPKDLTPPKNAYVVWMETKENGTKNLGQVNSEHGLFSKARKAELSAVTTFAPTRIFITAEDDAKIENPGYMVVMTTEDFKND